jgi:hypothetical protein
MESKDEAGTRSEKPRIQNIVLLLVAVISVVLTAFALVTIGTSSQVPSSDFVAIPTQQLSTTGDKVAFTSVSDIAQNGLAVGVKGYLMAASGTPVTGAKVYITYYLRGAYRTQVATTNQNGYFEAHFPMNWTGWLPLTLTYFGDDQHQGLMQFFSVSGEGT